MMGSDVFESQEVPLHPSQIKVHLDMCTQLMGLVNRISSVLLDIEVAPPQCLLGIQTLCQLRNSMEIAVTLVRNCCESSKLYLALTGGKVVSRFEQTKNLLQKSLSLLQNMVPVVSQFKILEILGDLRSAVFFMDSHEEEAGKALRALLRQNVVNPVGMSDIEVLHFAALKLHLSSQKDLLIERKSIRKLLQKLQEGNSTKRQALKYLLNLLENYNKLYLTRQTNSTENEGFHWFDCNSMATESANLKSCLEHAQDIDRPSMIHSLTPADEFKSVVKHMNVVPDSKIYPSAFSSRETYSNSICKTASSIKDLCLQIDVSNISLGSLDSFDSLEFSHAKAENNFSSVRKPSVGSRRFQFFRSIQDIRRQFLSHVSELPWESQCRAVQDVRDNLVYLNPFCDIMSCENFLDPLVQFLKDALDKHDAEAQKTGVHLLSTFLRISRKEAIAVHEDIYIILASFLGTEATAEIFAILEVLSTEESAFHNFSASGALDAIIKFLDSDHNTEFQAAAIRILFNLSSSIDTCSSTSAMSWIPILVRLLGDNSVSGTCLNILENLCEFEEAMVSIAETNGCIGSIVEILETGNCEDQEHGLGILSFLCAQREHYCHLAGHEGVIPSLLHVSVNGSEEGKIRALKLLRLFRDTRIEDVEESCRSNSDASDNCLKKPEEKRSSRKSGSVGQKMKSFFRKN